MKTRFCELGIHPEKDFTYNVEVSRGGSYTLISSSPKSWRYMSEFSIGELVLPITMWTCGKTVANSVKGEDLGELVLTIRLNSGIFYGSLPKDVNGPDNNEAFVYAPYYIDHPNPNINTPKRITTKPKRSPANPLVL